MAVNDRTRRVVPTGADGDESKTWRLPRPDVHQPPGVRTMPLGVLPAGHELCDDCMVKETLSPHESQRPGLYYCVAPEGDVVVKVAPADYPPKPDVWRQLPDLQHPNVLRTYRTVEVGFFFYEVQEYCNEGTLADRLTREDQRFSTFTADWVMDELMPQIHAGLKYLHERDIVHRDVKPSNIYRKRSADGKGTLVLGDFDISAVLDRTHTSRDTQRIAGTWYYSAPEAFPRFVDEQAVTRRGRVTRSADYYSLGVTIVELLQGTTSLHMCELPDLFDFYLQGNVVEIPRNIPERLSLLLRGLLIRNRQARWGAEEIDRWLRNAVTVEDRKRIRDDTSYVLPRVSQPYRLKEHSPVDLPGLADAMYREPDAATEDLMSGDILLHWVGAIDANKAREIRSMREHLRQKPDLALFAAIMICDPSRPFIFAGGQEAHSSSDWFDFARSLAAAEAGSEAMLGRLATWLRLKVEPEERIAAGVQGILTSPPDVRFEELAYLIDPGRPYTIAPGIEASTPPEIARATYGSPGDWAKKMPDCYEASFKLWKGGFLSAWMRQRGLGAVAGQAGRVEADLTGQPYAAFEVVLRLLCPDLPPVQVKLDLAEVGKGLRVARGQSRTIALPYSTVGCGMPFGGLKIEDGRPGLSLSDQLIRSRSGVVHLELDSRAGIPMFRAFRGRIHLEGGYTSLAGGPVAFTYSVRLPVALTLSRIALGVFLGGILAGVPRWIVADFGITAPPHPHYDPHWLWNATRAGAFPFLNFIGAAAVTVGVFYAAWRVWLWAMSESKA